VDERIFFPLFVEFGKALNTREVGPNISLRSARNQSIPDVYPLSFPLCRRMVIGKRLREPLGLMGDEMMKTFSAYKDDGITVMVKANNGNHAADRSADRIAEIGFEFDLDFFEDDIDDSYVSDDETVTDWLKSHGVKFNESNMLVMEWNGIEQNIQIVNL
jgi:hypothetical protein